MTRFLFFLILFLASLSITNCNEHAGESAPSIVKPEKIVTSELTEEAEPVIPILPYDTTSKTIHILVALCDNFYQGIAPVPEGIGNGQDPRTNLYWGCGYGIKTYFKKSNLWQLIKVKKVDSVILERAIFKHNTANYYLVADAYDGRFIKTTTRDFLLASSGQVPDTVHVNHHTLGIKSHAQLLAYIGHNGLMDFEVEGDFTNTDGHTRDVMMLACASRQYFEEKFDTNFVRPIVWTKALMAPEAYTIHDAIEAYINEEPDSVVLDKAISAYAKYQKCGKKGAGSILVSGY